MKKLTLILLITQSINLFGQVAIIKDKDGFTNVRSEPNGKSEIIYKIFDNEVFWYDYEDNVDKNEWIPIFIPKNDYSFCCTDPDWLNGFIHKSRLQPLNELESYKNSDFKFKYDIQPFDSTNKIIDRQEGKWVVFIEGRPVWGEDGDFPDTQINGIEV